MRLISVAKLLLKIYMTYNNKNFGAIVLIIYQDIVIWSENSQKSKLNRINEHY